MYNTHGNQFAPPPFFSQPPSNAAQPYPQGIQRPPPFAAHNANQKHFESNNNHAPSPPVMPFQLPPNINLEELKTIAARTGIPLPPPPIPPHAFPPNFSHNPFTPPTQPQQSSQSYPYQHPSQSTLLPATSSLGNRHRSSPLLSDVNRQELGIRQTISHPQQNPVYSQIPGLDGDVASRLWQPSTASTPVQDHLDKAWNGQPGGQNIINLHDGSNGVAQHQAPAYQYEKAKDAIQEIVSIGVTYQNLVDEGIAAPLLDKLFSDLGIGHQSLPNQPKQQQVPAQRAADRPSPSGADEESRQTIAAPQPDVLDPAMERKDRIAQLLAARKGQNTTSNKSSQSASPAPLDVPSRQPTTTRDTTTQFTETGGTENSEQDVEVAASQFRAGGILPEPASNISQAYETIPTPVRQELQEQGFAIPGLFMTSGDSLDNLPLHKQGSASTDLGPLKRTAEAFPSEALPHAKRQVSQSLATVNATPYAKEPAILTHDSAPSSSPITPSPAPTTSDKPADSAVQTNRSKINQDRLKNRMAALKADLLRRNSRKKALQDGMPALDAEVEKTRERLLAQQSALNVLRQEIATRSSELEAMRQQEDVLVQEIARLELHLADGENGQQQFSRELTQLNDQIVADEQASHTSAGPAAVGVQQATLHDVAGGDKYAADTYTTPSSTDAQTVLLQSQSIEDPLPLKVSVSLQDMELDTTVTPDNAVAMHSAVSQAEEVVSQSNESAAPASMLESVSPKSAQASISPTSDEGQVEDSDDDAMSIDEASEVDSTGSVSMSDSSSEYEPALDNHNLSDHPNDGEEVDEYEPDEAVPNSFSIENDNDDYEPAEKVDVLNVETLDDLRDSGDSVDNKTPTSTNAPDPIADELEAAPFVEGEDLAYSQLSRIGSADLRPSPMRTVDTDFTPVETPSAMNHSPLIVPTKDDPDAVLRYMPYESPLASFKSFRFHPRFNELVKDGYRSLTYSNRIDPKKPICGTELQGQMCTDADCDDQHFGTMALSDDKILVQMSSANDIRDKVQRDQYLLGLKKVIADLRGQGVKEFSEVANALSKYRREWMSQQDGIVT